MGRDGMGSCVEGGLMGREMEYVRAKPHSIAIVGTSIWDTGGRSGYTAQQLPSQDALPALARWYNGPLSSRG